MRQIVLAAALVMLTFPAFGQEPAMPPVVYAATPNGWIELTTGFVCENNGAVLNFILHWGWGALIAVVPFMASLAGNFRNRMSPTTVKYLDLASGDVASYLRSKAVAAAEAKGQPADMAGVHPPPSS